MADRTATDRGLEQPWSARVFTYLHFKLKSASDDGNLLLTPVNFLAACFVFKWLSDLPEAESKDKFSQNKFIRETE